MRLKIRARSPYPSETRVWLCDDVAGESVELKLGDDLLELMLVVRDDATSVVALKVTPAQLDIDAASLMQLQARHERETTIRGTAG